MLNNFFMKVPHENAQIRRSSKQAPSQTFNSILYKKSYSNQKYRETETNAHSKIDSLQQYQDLQISNNDELQNPSVSTISYKYPIMVRQPKYQIEDHLRRQNNNLKQQINFLSKQVRKAIKKALNYKETVKEYNAIITKLQKQNDTMKLECLQINQKTNNFIQKLKENPQLVTMFRNDIQQINPNFNLEPQNQQPQQMINKSIGKKQQKNKSKPLQNKNSYTVEKNPKQQNFYQPQPVSKMVKCPSQFKRFYAIEKEIQENNQLEQLNRQFQQMIQEFKISKDSLVRKKCISLAKQIQQLKKNNEISQRSSKNINKSKKFNVQTNLQHKTEFELQIKDTVVDDDDSMSSEDQDIYRYLPQNRNKIRSYAK